MPRKLLGSPRRATVEKPARLQFEALEDRTAPATLVGLTTADRLLFFDSATPTVIQRNVKITGVSGKDVVGLDARPADGRLYALASDASLYTINPLTGRATLVGTSGVTLSGNRFSIDFNPGVDRLRVVSNQDQNFRLNPNNGALAGTDTVLSGTPNPNVVAAAYDRNFQGAALTTLYGIDAAANSLVLIGGLDGTPSPNLGAVTTVGALGFDPANRIGFDVAADGTAYAAFKIGATALKLYTIDLNTGAAAKVGKIGAGSDVLDALTALPREEIVFAVTATNRLLSFRADTPGQLLSAVGIKGLIFGENVTDIDFRPATGELFALTSLNRMLIINTSTGQASQVGAQIDPTLFSTFGARGFDFNPSVDRLRLVNAGDTNFRYNPLTFALVDNNPGMAGVQPDTSLAFDAGDVNAGDDPLLAGVAYDRNDNDPATGTTLWGIDSGNDALVTVGGINGTPSPNGGLLFTTGTLVDGLGATVDVTDVGGFDVVDDGVLGDGVALAALQVTGAPTSTLYTVNLNGTGLTNQPRGSMKAVGTIAGGELIRAMAVAPPSIQFTKPAFTVKENAGTITINVTRTGGTGSTGSVLFSILPGTATGGGVDFNDAGLINVVVTFERGETKKTVTIPIVNDTADEDDETLFLSLSAPTGGTTILGTNDVSVLTILDND
jgi:hypothetical protein